MTCKHMLVRWAGQDSGGTYFHCQDCGADLVAEELDREV